MSEILEFMNVYGWPGIIALIIVLALYIAAKYLKKHNKKHLDNGIAHVAEVLANSMTAQNESVLKAIDENNKQMLDFISTTIQKNEKELLSTVEESNRQMLEYIINGKDKEHKESMDTRLMVMDPISQNIRDLSNLTHASRVGVLEFHNSKENFSGLAFVWYDMQYEWPAKGVEPITDTIKNIQASRMLPVIKKINNTPQSSTVIYNRAQLEELQDSEPLLYYDLITKLNLSHIIYSGIYDAKTSKLIGLLSVEYNYDIDDSTVENMVNDCANTAAVIGNLLTFSRDN